MSSIGSPVAFSNFILIDWGRPKDLTVGYEELENMLLLTVNGVVVKNLRQVRDLVEACQPEEFLRFTLHNNLILVLRAEDARKATPEALEKHGIPSATSPDLDDVDVEVEAGDVKAEAVSA